MGGDINVHVNDAGDPDARRLSDLLVSFDVAQHVTSATHRCGSTLDLVMTFAGCSVDISVDPTGLVSDHALLVCRVPLHVGLAATAERIVRGWRQVDRDELRRALMDTPLCTSASRQRRHSQRPVVYI